MPDFCDLVTVSSTDAQALVQAVLAVEVAIIATILIFFQQATTRFGQRVGVHVLRLVGVWLPGLGSLALVATSLVLWTQAVPEGDQRSRLLPPIAVGLALLDRYNHEWILERHGYLTPTQARATLTTPLTLEAAA